MRQVPLRLDINYNWEGGAWHPVCLARALGGILPAKTRVMAVRFGRHRHGAGHQFRRRAGVLHQPHGDIQGRGTLIQAIGEAPKAARIRQAWAITGGDEEILLAPRPTGSRQGDWLDHVSQFRGRPTRSVRSV